MGENSFGGRRIMVVEDDYLLVAGLIETLEAMGAEVVGPIPNVDQALRRLQSSQNIDGAVLDVNVQGKMVFPLAEALSQQHVPYVFATGYDEGAVPAKFAEVTRFSKPTNDQAIALTLLAALQPQEIS